VIHEVGAAALGLFRNRFLGLALGTDKQHGTAVARNLTHETAGFAEHLQSLLQIDNVNAVALSEDVFLHLGIPTTRLVTEVNTGLQQLLHGNFNRHFSSLVDSCFSWRTASEGGPYKNPAAASCRQLAGRDLGGMKRLA
jgi:hypothetical protein